MNTGDLISSLDDLFAGFDTAFAAADAQTQLAPGGARLTCRTVFARYAETLDHALADSIGRNRADCQVLVAFPESLGLTGVPAWNEPYYRERAVETALAATRYRLNHMLEIGFWQFYDRQTGRGIQLLRDAESLPLWDSGSPLRNFLHWHLNAADRSLVHAGSLGIGGHGVLLSGAGGSGKSGTVLAGVLHGLETVGDDYLLVTAPTTAPVLAEPLFKTLKTDPAGYARLGLARFSAIPRTLNWQGKHQFALADIGAEARAEGLEIHAICLPEVGGGAVTRFEEVSAKQAFLAMAPSSVSQIPGDRDISFSVAAALARKLPAFRMRLSPDPAEIAYSVACFIEGLGR